MSLREKAGRIAEELWENAKQAGDAVDDFTREQILVGKGDEFEQWKGEGLTKGVLKLSVAKMEAQLYFGWIAQHILPTILEHRLRNTIDVVENWVGKRVAEGLLGKASKALVWVRLFIDLAEFWEESREERKIEVLLRGKSVDFQREVLILKSHKRKKVVKTCIVRSRNKTKVQRRENESWTDRKN